MINSLTVLEDEEKLDEWAGSILDKTRDFLEIEVKKIDFKQEFNDRYPFEELIRMTVPKTLVNEANFEETQGQQQIMFGLMRLLKAERKRQLADFLTKQFKEQRIAVREKEALVRDIRKKRKDLSVERANALSGRLKPVNPVTKQLEKLTLKLPVISQNPKETVEFNQV